jgi:hypothetical protein
MDDSDVIGLVFVAEPSAGAALEIRVNFGIFAGRIATPAEIDRLAESLLDEVDALTIVAEERHEFGHAIEGSVHLVRIEVADERLPAREGERDAVVQRCVERAERWAAACIADRHVET